MSADLGWDEARAAAAHLLGPRPPRALPLRDAVGARAAEDVLAPRPVPHYDSSAMDGYAVAGPPPWRRTRAEALSPGEYVLVVTGGAVPDGATAVVPVERANLEFGVLTAPEPEPGRHIRRAGEEAPAGTLLVAAGRRLSPADVAVLAIAGLDTVLARPALTVAPILTGDEVVTAGMPGPGRVRDAFDPLLPLAIEGLGLRPSSPVRIGDDEGVLAAVIGASDAEAVVTVGGTGRSAADRLRAALARLGARIVVEGVGMRPGHPAVLAVLADGRPLLGLPGNPLAAIAALASLLPPIAAGADGVPAPEPQRRRAARGFDGYDGGVSLVPSTDGEDGVVPAAAVRPNMLRGLAASDGLAVVPPGGAPAGGEVRWLPHPWSAGTSSARL